MSNPYNINLFCTHRFLIWCRRVETHTVSNAQHTFFEVEDDSLRTRRQQGRSTRKKKLQVQLPCPIEENLNTPPPHPPPPPVLGDPYSVPGWHPPPPPLRDGDPYSGLILIPGCTLHVKNLYPSGRELSYAIYLRTVLGQYHIHLYTCMLFVCYLNFVLSAKSMKYTEINRIRNFCNDSIFPPVYKSIHRAHHTCIICSRAPFMMLPWEHTDLSRWAHKYLCLCVSNLFCFIPNH